MNEELEYFNKWCKTPGNEDKSLIDCMKDYREDERAKLRALLEGLETQQVEKLISIGKVGDFRNYGIAYMQAVKDKIDKA